MFLSKVDIFIFNVHSNNLHHSEKKNSQGKISIWSVTCIFSWLHLKQYGNNSLSSWTYWMIVIA